MCTNVNVLYTIRYVAPRALMIIARRKTKNLLVTIARARIAAHRQRCTYKASMFTIDFIVSARIVLRGTRGKVAYSLTFSTF